MGVCGRFIDSLNDEQRDWLVRAQRWQGGSFWDDGHGRCLVGHSHDIQPCGIPSTFIYDGDGRHIPRRFDGLVARFGMDRIVRAIKLRAGASVEDLTHKPDPEPVS